MTQQKPLPRRWASIQTVAEYLGLFRRTVHTMLAEGVFPSYQLRRRSVRSTVRVDLNEVDAAMVPIPSARSWG